MTPLQAARKEKREILRSIYGGMMTLADLSNELGYSNPRSTARWIQETGAPATMVGTRKKYDTDIIARILVDRRGMA